MTKASLLAVDKAKKDGRWDKADQPPQDYSIENFIELIKYNSKAFEVFIKLSKAIQRNLSMSYFTLKRSESRQRRSSSILRDLK